MKLVPLVEIMRYAGAVMVMLFHVFFLPSGYKGVDLFFVISGFVLYHRYLTDPGQDEPVMLYFIRRFSKIYLLYWTALCVYLLTIHFPIGTDFWKTIVLWPVPVSIIVISWSLSYELYFYTLFGLLLFFGRPRIRHLLGWLLLLISTIVTLISMFSPILKGSALNFLAGHNTWEFMLGWTAGFLAQKKPLRSMSGSYIVCLAGFLALCCLSLPYTNAASAPIYGFCGFIAIYGAANIPAPGGGATTKIIALLGRSSYAIYLFHPVFMDTLKRMGITNYLIQIVIVTGLSILINRLYEEPLLRQIRKGARRLITSGSPVSPHSYDTPYSRKNQL